MQTKFIKTIFPILLSCFLAISALAQSTHSVNIIFNGINSDTKNYKVSFDGQSYFSNKNYNSNNDGDQNTVSINNPARKKHAIQVYRLGNNNPKYNATSKKTIVYSKNFVSREGYVMDITINSSGQVQFSETSSSGNGAMVDKIPMINADFNQLLQSVRNKFSQALKGETVNDAFNNTNNYFTTSQIRQLLTLITSESDRVDLAKLSYRSVIDSSNFTQLYDLFKAKASRDELNDFLGSRGWNSINNQSLVKASMPDNKFNTLLQSVRDKFSQALKGETINDAFNNTNNYFSTSQIRQLLTLVTSESDRVGLAKVSYRSVTDTANFAQLYDLFKAKASRDDLNDFLRSRGSNSTNDQSPIKAPMPDNKFNALLQSVRGKFSQALKGETINDAFNNTNNYFSTSQVRQLLTLITSESDRVDLAKLSYRSVVDSANFTQLYGLLKTKASRDNLNDFLRSKGWNYTNDQYLIKTPMPDNKFNSLLQSVEGKWSQALKGETENEAFNNTNNYFTTSQIGQLLILITSENDRLDLAKLSYRSVTDSANFTRLYDLFKNQESIDDLNTFLRTKGWPVTNPTSLKNPMAEADFNQVVNNVHGYLIQFLKVGYETEVFNNLNNYFTSSQIRQLLLLINAESNRLVLAKLAYRSVTDPANFAQLNDLFTSQSSRDDLANYIKNQ